MAENNKIVKQLVNFVKEQRKINLEQREINLEQREFNREQKEIHREQKLINQSIVKFMIHSEKQFRLFYHLITNLQKK